MPAPRLHVFYNLNFQRGKIGRSCVALCLECNKVLSNTAESRLISHRRICKQKTIRPEIKMCRLKRDQFVPDTFDGITQDNTILEELDSQQHTNFVEVVYVKTDSNEGGGNNDQNDSSSHTGLSQPQSSVYDIATYSPPVLLPFESTESCSSSSNSPVSRNSASRLKTKRMENLQFKKKIEDFQNALQNFFFCCNIPMSVVESDHFLNFIKSMRPNYVKYIPSRKKLSASILDKVHDMIMTEGTNESG